MNTGAFADYESAGVFDEMLDRAGQPRQHYRKLYNELLELTPDHLARCKQQADLTFFNQGITFTVYGRTEGTDRPGQESSIAVKALRTIPVY